MKPQVLLRASRCVFCFAFINEISNILKISHSCMSEISALPLMCPETFDVERLQPKVIVGDMSQAILSTEYIPEKSVSEPIGELRNLTFRERLRYVMRFNSHNNRYRPLWQAIAHSTLGVGPESRPR